MLHRVSDINAPALQTPRQSRRERPAKPALSRALIIDVASGILRNQGLAKVTMRRVAEALDTGHASLYVYVRDTEDLHAGILDAKLAAINTRVAKAEISTAEDGNADDQTADDWKTRLKGLLSQYKEVLFEHPEIAKMALSTRPDGPHYTALVEAILALLVEGGVSDRAAAWGVDVLMLYPVAIAAEHASSRAEPPTESPRIAEVAAIARQLAAVDPATHPQIVRLSRELVSGDGSSRSDWALEVLIGGIVASDHTP
jgi:AcrR family transcriptional regulator